MPNVTIQLVPPRKVETHKASYRLTAEGLPMLDVPSKLTTLTCDDANEVTAIEIPLWLAEDRGLAAGPEREEFVVEEDQERMTRDDWFLLGTTMAMLIRGTEPRNAVWEAMKLVPAWRLCLSIKERDEP